jgi:hypothetical protein
VTPDPGKSSSESDFDSGGPSNQLTSQPVESAASVVGFKSTPLSHILDDGSDIAIVRLQGESPDLWIVNRFSGDGGSRRCHPRHRLHAPQVAARAECGRDGLGERTFVTMRWPAMQKISKREHLLNPATLATQKEQPAVLGNEWE